MIGKVEVYQLEIVPAVNVETKGDIDMDQFVMVVRMSIPGKDAKFNGVVLGLFQENVEITENGVPRISIPHTILAIPHSLAKYKDDIMKRRGRVSKDLAKAIDRSLSVMIGEVMEEVKKEMNDPWAKPLKSHDSTNVGQPSTQQGSSIILDPTT